MKILEKAIMGWRYLLVAPFLFMAHISTFFLHNGIPLLSKEYLVSLLIVFIACSPLGLLMVFGGIVLRILTAAGLAALFIVCQVDNDSLTDILGGLRYRYAVILLGLGIAVGCYFIRQHLDKFLTLVFGLFLLGSFFTSAGSLIEEQKFDVSGKLIDLSLPPYIHIILDEHIGIEGIPPSEDPNHEFANALKDKYIQNGFQVYGRAYSRYTQSLQSFASFLGLRAIDDPNKYVQGNATTQHLKENRFFRELSKKGYHINIMQSSYLDMCDKSGKYSIKRCITHSFAALPPVGSSNSLSANLSIIFSNVITAMRLNSVHEMIRKTRLGRVFNLQEMSDTNPTSPTSTYKAFPEAVKLVHGAQMGNAYFIHVLLPHRPFVFDRECSHMGTRGSNNETNYGYYLEQIGCSQLLMDQLLSKLKENSNAKESTIVVQGDHGSRIVFPGKDFSAANNIQSFSTFFAVRGPGYKPVYDRRPLPLDHLLSNVILSNGYDTDETNGKVYLQKTKEQSSELIPTPLSPFSQGLPAMKW